MDENKINTPQNEEEKKKKKGIGAWWDALPKVAKIVGCSVAGVGVISAVVFPTLAATVWNKGSKPVDPEPVPPTPIKEWYEDSAYINGLKDSDIGTIKEVTVNGQVHKVRLIGIKHDVDEHDNKIHTTWEFATLISDSEGFSLAYLWDDVNSNIRINRNYLNSSIRKALCGSGEFTGDVLCAQKGQFKWSSTYKNTTILSMLPTGLISNLKTVKKSVGTTQNYTETFYTDKLFMPSIIELGHSSSSDKGFGTTYSYYSGHTGQTDPLRAKQQVKNILSSQTQINSDQGQKYQQNVTNYAGFDSSPADDDGGIYWLRSPSSSDSSCAWITGAGGQSRYTIVNENAFAVAPAFCL